MRSGQASSKVWTGIPLGGDNNLLQSSYRVHSIGQGWATGSEDILDTVLLNRLSQGGHIEADT